MECGETKLWREWESKRGNDERGSKRSIRKERESGEKEDSLPLM